MARYPAFAEYAAKGNYGEGIKRCDELLKRNPKDSTLLTVKLQLLAHSNGNIYPTLDQLLAVQPPIMEISDLVNIEQAVVDSLSDIYPTPLTVGATTSKLWENASKASNSPQYKFNLIEIRFDRAVMDNRIQDVQQTLISLKALQPKNRAVYMAHAAYTQLLSTSKGDLQSRLALGLARKAVNDSFDVNAILDCRVPGQIFAIQGSTNDLESIRDKKFGESKQVHDSMKLDGAIQNLQINGGQEESVPVDAAKVPPRVWLVAEADLLKVEFAKLIEAKAAVNVLLQFVANAVRLFHTGITALDLGGRDRGAADACFLAISGLVKIFEETKSTSYLLHASFLADRLLQFNDHIHEARLILVYLYMRLNLGSLAMYYFDSLNVKEIQHDTVGHTLFSRLSTTHPFRTFLSANTTYEPYEKTQKALAVYGRHEHKLAETESNVLQHAQTGMIFDLNELRVNLRDSLTRRMFLLEHRRIARLTGKPPGRNTNEKICPRVVADWANTKDNRDFNAAFDYGLNVEKALYSEGGAIPGKRTLLYNLAADTAWSLASKTHSPLILDPENLGAAIASSPASGTAAEHLCGSLLLNLLPILKPGSSPTKESIETLLSELQNLPISSLTTTTDPLAEHLTDHYLFLDTLRILSQSCRFIKESAEHIPVQVAELHDFAKKNFAALQKHAQEQAASLKVADIREKISKDEVLTLFSEGDLQIFCEAVVGSAKEGWEGASKITLS